MKIGTLVCLLVVVTVSPGTLSAQLRFDQTRDRMHQLYDRKLPDGTVKPSKQVARWEWFWQPRLLEGGVLPSSMMWLDATKQIEARMAKGDQVQARPTWKEIGPIAPDLPSATSVWNGIGRVNTFDISHQNMNVMWAGTAQGGLWKTTNGGGSWTFVPVQGYPMFGVSDIAIATTNDQIIYVATGDSDASIPTELGSYPGFSYGVVKTTDGGQTWAPTGLTMQPDLNNLVARLWVDPRDPNVVLAATYSGIMKSTNGGTSWRLVTAALTFKDLIGNPQSFDILYATTFTYNSGGARIFRSTNIGETWQEVLSVSEGNRIRLAVSKADPKMVGAVCSDGSSQGLYAIYKSMNYGESFVKSVPSQNLLGWSPTGNDWQNGGQGFYDLAMEISPSNANLWFVGGVNCWKSTNAGQTWSLSAHWTGAGAPWVHADHHFMKYSYSQNRLYTASDGGIARSTDNGSSWRDISNGLSIQQYYNLGTSDQNTSLTIAGAQDNGTALSKNNTSFSHVVDGDGMMCDIDKSNANLLYASQPYGTFYRSTDQGSTWRMISSAGARGESRGAFAAPIAVDPKTTNTLYIGYSQIFKSTDRGSSWTRISNNTVSSYMRRIAVAPSDSRFIYVAHDTELFYTTNGGQSWTKQTGLGEFIQDIEVNPTDPRKIYVTFGGFAASVKVFEINGGAITNISGTGIPNVPVNAVLFQPGTLNRLYIGTDVGVMFKDQGSNTWEPYGIGMPATVVTDIDLVAPIKKLRVSTFGRGVWEVDANQCLSSKPTVSVQGLTTVCAGDSVVLQASDGFTVYQWSDGTRNSRLVLKGVSQTGEYRVSVEDENGCRNISDAIQVTILRSPVKPSITLRAPDTLRSSAIGGITVFQWYRSGDLIPGAVQREYVVTQNGSYSVRAFNSDNCGTLSEPYTLAVGVDDEGELEMQSAFRCWPNPTTGAVELTMPLAQSRVVEMLDLIGNTLYATNVDDGASNIHIDLSQHASGTYVIRARSGSSVWSRLVIKR